MPWENKNHIDATKVTSINVMIPPENLSIPATYINCLETWKGKESKGWAKCSVSNILNQVKTVEVS
jgi:phage protein D